jgi:hypothetical protein
MTQILPDAEKLFANKRAKREISLKERRALKGIS